VRLTGRDGTERELRTTALGPRHHEVALPPLEEIESRIEIITQRDGKALHRHEEWLPAPAASGRADAIEDPEAEPDRSLLQQIAEITGGAVDASLDEILRRAPAERQFVSPLGEWFVLASLA